MQLLSKTEALAYVRAHLPAFEQAEKDNPFAGAAWTLHFLEQVAEDAWTIVVPEDGADGSSLMLLYGDAAAPQRRSALTNYYASLHSPIVSSLPPGAARRAALERMVKQLTQARPRCAVLDFMPLDADAPETAQLQQALAAAGWYTRRYDTFGNWILPCAGLAFDDYMRGRDSRTFNTWTRKRKKFESGAAGGARLEIIQAPEDVDRGMDAYEHVYARSWKKPEPYRDFVRGWARICARNGWLRLGIAWLGEQPIAAQFWFTLHGRASIFKLAYDEEHTKLSAGTVLSAHLFRQALDVDRVVEIDYLTGDDAYKKSWMSQRRQRVGILACNPWTAQGLLQAGKEIGGELTRPWRARWAARNAAGTSPAPATETAVQPDREGAA